MNLKRTPLLETDVEKRKLERQSLIGGPKAKIVSIKFARRSGDRGPLEAHMAAHAKEFKSAEDGYTTAVFQNRSIQDVNNAKRRISQAHHSFHQAAKDVGEPAGKFVTRDTSHDQSHVLKRDSKRSHVHTLARLHGSRDSRIPYGETKGSASFKNPQDANDFVESFRHHYPDAKHKIGERNHISFSYE